MAAAAAVNGIGHAGAGHASPAREVLVVEDDPEINQLVGAYCEIAGFRYLCALNGADALAQVRDHHPAAIILDLMLPDLSGWEICRLVKNSDATHHVPVIILTALDNDDSRREGFLCGAADYLIKPFDPDRFMETLQRHASPKENGNGSE